MEGLQRLYCIFYVQRLKQNEQLQRSRKEVIFDKDEGMQMFFPLEISDQKKKLGIFNKNF